MEIRKATMAARSIILLLTAPIIGCGVIRNTPDHVLKQRDITIDGDLSDWQGVTWYEVADAGKQWFGQGITVQGWQGPSDLSFSWAGAWDGKGRLFFAIKAVDDIVLDPPLQSSSFLNDNVEILIDFCNSGGPRHIERNGTKELRGYELHFMPMSNPLVFIDDSLYPTAPESKRPIANPQNALFASDFDGCVEVKQFDGGYILETGFTIPGVPLGDGAILGIDADICDDDGKGRESLLLWHSGQVDFWVTMDHYGKFILRKED
ncbi:MAG: hypothetical protein JW741_07085 [Sedimentisphaerales bacterium]|nr:hypothetical protein [Sedimentisphaerales bacterium]